MVAGETSHYRLTTLGAGEPFSLNSYKYVNADRQLIDLLLALGAELHQHSGTAAASMDPVNPPSLVQSAAGGSIPAGTTVHYRFSFVDANGFESAASPEASVITPSPIAGPNAPSLSSTTTGGTLLPGQYYYVLSAYKGANTLETRALSPAYITLPSTTSTSTITLGLPTLPTGADGFNIYRRKPGANAYRYLASTTSTSYVDTGSVVEDATRVLPTSNTTNSANQVTVSLPGATPNVPAGYTWRLYRTYISNNYTNSLLHWVVEETSLGSGVIVTSYVDGGAATSVGQPLNVTGIPGSPSKVLLTGGAEVQGLLPASMVTGLGTADSAFTDAALVNSWVVVSSRSTPGYFKDTNGVVHLRGAVKNGSAATIFTLPSGYRPAALKTFAAVANTGATPTDTLARVDVASTGVVSCVSPSPASVFLSLEGITFVNGG